MTSATVIVVKDMIAVILEPKLRACGLTMADVSDDLDLRDRGIVDSLGFLNLMLELEDRLGGPLDLADVDPEHLTNVGFLARHIAAQRLPASSVRPSA